MEQSERPAEQLFPPADPPNLIRAQQKDELYLQHLADACHDGVRRVLGPRAALRWASETRLAAELLYWGLTTGGGRQTLGEEYCDILQVAAAGGAAGGLALPGAARRGLLVLLQAAGPYLADRLAAAGEEDDGFGDGGWAAWREAQAAAAAAARQPQRQGEQQQQQQQLSRRRQLLQRLAAAAQALREAAAAAAQPVTARLPAAAALLREHGVTLLRLHLALFYLYGRYYQPAKRAAGVRFVFLGRPPQGRPSYHALGLLLLAQLALSGALWLRRRHGAALLGLAGGEAGGGGGGRKAGGVAMLGEGGEPLAEAPEADAGGAAGGEVPPGRRCPLCLCTRAHPTATPCGHVFCWRCVTEWCAQRPEQPECPLCRAEFRPCELVVVRHADF